MQDTFEKISVHTQNSDEYAIHVGEGVFERIEDVLPGDISRSATFVMIDENVDQLHGEYINSVLNKIFSETHKFVVPAGEQSKCIAEYERAVDFVLSTGVTRKTALLAIGGGVTGDLAGYVASSVMRGIPLVHVPTTLLAMVDSSIGGKTGINHPSGKNLIGAFYQPRVIISDIRFLSTLSRKEWANGLSEILKYAAIRAPGIFTQLAELTDKGTFSQPRAWIPVIRESAAIKVNVVEEDVLESGVREFLNFGHTFAHAIENVSGYNTFSHGEAVFAGMFAVTYASNELGAEIDVERFRSFKALYDFQLASLKENIEKLIELMKRDKKVKDDQIRLVLLNDFGSPVVRPVSDMALLNDAWEFAIAEFT